MKNKLLAAIMALLLPATASAMQVKTDFDSFEDEFSRISNTKLMLGYDLDNGYSVYGGISEVSIDDADSHLSERGMAVHVSKRYKHWLVIRSTTQYVDSRWFSTMNLSGNINRRYRYEIECSKDFIDNLISWKNSYDQIGCMISSDYSNDQWSHTLGVGRYHVDDGNNRDIFVYRSSYLIGDWIQMELKSKLINNSIKSNFYFSPDYWSYTYLMPSVIKSFNGLSFKAGIGYGTEYFDGNRTNPILHQVRLTYDKTDKMSLYMNYEKKLNGYEYTMCRFGFVYRF